MSETGKSSLNRGRIGALLVVALLIVTPVVWIAWSLHAASVARAAAESEAELLAGFRQRLEELAQNPADAGPAIDAESIYLPGETDAIAGAALQRLVAEAIEKAGGRVLESELGIAEPDPADPGRIDLRISFETEIEGLQRIVFELETGAPILMLKGLDVRSVDATEVAATESPTLRVVMVVEAHRDAGEALPQVEG
jgi:hypothetical protein